MKFFYHPEAEAEFYDAVILQNKVTDNTVQIWRSGDLSSLTKDIPVVSYSYVILFHKITGTRYAHNTKH